MGANLVSKDRDVRRSHMKRDHTVPMRTSGRYGYRATTSTAGGAGECAISGVAGCSLSSLWSLLVPPTWMATSVVSSGAVLVTGDRKRERAFNVPSKEFRYTAAVSGPAKSSAV